MENNTHYGCPVCGGEVTQEQFEDGQTTCQNENCDRFGKPLEEMEYCASCDEYYSADQAESHKTC